MYRGFQIAAALRKLSLYALEAELGGVTALQNLLLSVAATLLRIETVLHNLALRVASVDCSIVTILKHVGLQTELVSHQRGLVVLNLSGVEAVSHLGAGKRTLSRSVAAPAAPAAAQEK